MPWRFIKMLRIPDSKINAFLEEMKAETVQKGRPVQLHLKKLFRHSK